MESWLTGDSKPFPGGNLVGRRRTNADIPHRNPRDVTETSCRFDLGFYYEKYT